jgi:hypothetical protein
VPKDAAAAVREQLDGTAERARAAEERAQALDGTARAELPARVGHARRR